MSSSLISDNQLPLPIRWLYERLREAVLWPINLIRDFSVRLRRLGQTIGRGLRGLIFFVPELVGTSAKKLFLKIKLERLGIALHQLVAQMFDLVGGPELVAFLLHLLTDTTPLTDDEVALATAVFGENALRYQEVRVVQGGLFDLIFKLNGNLGFATWHSINLPRNGRHTRANLPILIHELTHVYQYEQVGSRYLGEAIYMLVKTKRDCYNYGGAAGLQIGCERGLTFADLNREQQAMVVQDYFTCRQRGIDTTAYEPFIAQLRNGAI